MRIPTLASLASAAVLLAATAFPACASPYSSIVVFGDSLSDNGNLYNATFGLAPSSPPYYNGRFSNGPVSVEQLAAQLNAPLLDFAFGGATTGIGNIVDGGTQTTPGAFGLPGIAAELAGATVPAALLPTSLFIVWGGADDFESGGSPLTAANNIDSIVRSLELEGATNILVPNLPDLGETPSSPAAPSPAPTQMPSTPNSPPPCPPAPPSSTPTPSSTTSSPTPPPTA